MNTDLLQKVEQKYYKNDFNKFAVGDTVKVYNLIREGDKSRTQIFQGVVIAKKNSGLRSTFTVRKISDGIGVEKIFPVHSPNIEKIELTKKGKVRRSKLYYLRDRVGKSALKVGDGGAVPVEEVEESISEVVATDDSATDSAQTTEKPKEKAGEQSDSNSKAQAQQADSSEQKKNKETKTEPQE